MKKFLFAILFVLLFTGFIFAQENLEIYFLEVGQGDAVLIIASCGHVILVDSGPREEVILSHLESLEITRIDLVIASHAHADHIGGMATIIESYQPYIFLDPGIQHTTTTYENLLEVVEEQGIVYFQAAERSITLCALTFSVLPPADPLISRSALNNNSAVVRLDYGDFSVLFTGDIEKEREAQLLQDVPEKLDVLVLKVPHHGSRSSSTLEFLEAVNPEIAVIPCGKDNRYGHPHEETLNALESLEIEVYRTDEYGTILVKTDGNTYEVIPEFRRARSPPEITFLRWFFRVPPPSHPYVGSRKSAIFHDPHCVHAEMIHPHNLVEFESREEAVESGRRPCKGCIP